MDNIYNSYLEIDMDELCNNISKIRKGIGENTDIIAVLKGDAYGMGLVPIGRHLAENCGIKTFACAQTREAVQLRTQADFSGDILVMGGVPFHNIPHIVEWQLHSPAYNHQYLTLLNDEARAQNKTAAVHIKVETGLNRVGVWPGKQLDDLCLHLKTLDNIVVTGAFTHFVESEIADKTSTYEQLRLFKDGLEQIRNHGFAPKYVHAANTAASTWLQDPMLTHVRPAGLLFGFDVNIEPKNRFALKEVLSWNAFVTNVKTIEKGETVGYNKTFTAQGTTQIATFSAGYGDGYTRSLAMSGKAHVIVNGRRAPIVGICMDQTFLDVTGINVAVNDAVTLIGQNGGEYISIFELQDKMQQTYLATIAVVTRRVVRKYKYKEAIHE